MRSCDLVNEQWDNHWSVLARGDCKQGLFSTSPNTGGDGAMDSCSHIGEEFESHSRARAPLGSELNARNLSCAKRFDAQDQFLEASALICDVEAINKVQFAGDACSGGAGDLAGKVSLPQETIDAVEWETSLSTEQIIDFRNSQLARFRGMVDKVSVAQWYEESDPTIRRMCVNRINGPLMKQLAAECGCVDLDCVDFFRCVCDSRDCL